jgi:hypothetical protein
MADLYWRAGMLREAEDFGFADFSGVSDSVRDFEGLGVKFGPHFRAGFAGLVPALVRGQQLVDAEDGGNWAQRLAGAAPVFHAVSGLLLDRIAALGADGELEKVAFLELAAEAHEWRAFEAFYPKFFPDAAPIAARRARVNFLWATASYDPAVELLAELIAQTDDQVLKAQYVRFDIRRSEDWQKEGRFGQWAALVRGNGHPDCLFAWGWANLRLRNAAHSKLRQREYAETAFDAFVQLLATAQPARISDLMQLIDVGISGKKWGAADHLRDDAARAPDVDREIVESESEHQLRGAIPKRYDVRAALAHRDRKVAREPEVADLQEALVVEQKIVRLNVAVDNPM